MLVDTEGLVLEAKVHGAGVFDRDGIKSLLAGVRERFSAAYPPVVGHRLHNGQGKGKDWVEKLLGLTAEVVRHPPKPRYVWVAEGEEPDWEDLRRRGLLPEAGFRVLPRRWVVERTFSWIDQNRTMSKDYEKLPATEEAFVLVAMTRLMARRLARS